MKQNFFVGIKDPVRARRDLLSASKDIIDSLKRHDDFALIRQEKQKYITELKRVVDELVVLNKKLRGHLPKTPLELPDGARKKAGGHRPEKGIAVARSKLDVLEDELSKVESRLKALE